MTRPEPSSPGSVPLGSSRIWGSWTNSRGTCLRSSTEPWTAGVIGESIDRSLKRLQTDHLDLVQLHTPALEVLQRGEVIEALEKARDTGKTRFIGYSGDNEAAKWAIESGLFDTLQTSFNVVDQRARSRQFGLAKARGMGIIIKHPVANGAWGAKRSPYGYASEYFRRAQTVGGIGPIPGAPGARMLAAMGFMLSYPEVDTAIVGTRNPSHRGSLAPSTSPGPSVFRST